VELQKYEYELFLEVLHDRYGIDLRGNSQASLQRRLHVLMDKYQKQTVSELIAPLLHDNNFYLELLDGITVQYSYLFRDPLFFKALQERVFPYLQTYGKVTIWIAGCANGEELYSILIILKELDLLDKVQLYATDINPKALEIAASGILSKELTAQDMQRYNQSGGLYSLSDYFVARYGKYKLKDELLSHVVFEEHNLAQDGPFITAELILCRNVMIYFKHELQEKVVKLLDDSLIPNGYLGIGIDESLEFLESAKHFKQLEKSVSIYKKSFSNRALK